jgi:acetyltransferase-like isoleucine patch superfamily enzyme
MATILNRKPAEVLLRICEKLVLGPASTLRVRLALRFWGATVGRDLRVLGRVHFRLLGELHIGNRVRLNSGYSNYVGAGEPMAVWVCPGGHISIGDGCGLSNTTIVCLSRVEILAETYIGGGCRIYDNDFHQIAPEGRIANRGDVPSAPIRIGPRAFVGGHCVVLKGVSIGEGAVIGAGSLVTRDVPAFEIWAGVPARKIRELARS